VRSIGADKLLSGCLTLWHRGTAYLELNVNHRAWIGCGTALMFIEVRCESGTLLGTDPMDILWLSLNFA
jgi:hypothetical protein